MQEERLQDVQQIAASFGAFCGVTGDGAAVAWGDPDFGGDARKMWVEMWEWGDGMGWKQLGGMREADSHAVRHQLKDVKEVFATGFAFAALKVDGTVVTWGENYPGGDSRAVQSQLRDVRTIAASSYAFAAIKTNGEVITWGSKNPPVEAEELPAVQHIVASHEAFCAVTTGGRCVTWGDRKFGGDSHAVEERLQGVQQVVASFRAFAALTGAGAVVCWGDDRFGGMLPKEAQRFTCRLLRRFGHGGSGRLGSTRVRRPSPRALAEPPHGRELRGILEEPLLRGAAQRPRGDGRVITWGDPGFGGDSSTMAAVVCVPPKHASDRPEEGKVALQLQDARSFAELQLCLLPAELKQSHLKEDGSIEDATIARWLFSWMAVWLKQLGGTRPEQLQVLLSSAPEQAVERKAEVEIDPEAAMESPRAEGEETPVPPAWKEVYGGSRFEFKSLFPPFTWLPAYIRFAKGNATTGDTDRMGELPYSIKGDLIAGLTVGLMLVPQCLAFALLAGLPIRAGLYSSFAPLVIYALLGTLRQLQVGPTALISLLTGQALDAVNLLGENERLTGASTLALLVGLVSLLLGILRFGFVVDFMSHSVMSSFCTASGVIIATSQLKHVLGINIKRHKYWWETAYDLCSKLPEADAATAVLGFTLLAMLTFFKKWKQAGNQAKRSKSLIWRFFPKNKDSCAFKSMKICADLSSVLCVILGWVWGFIYREAGINSVRLINDSESDGFVFLLPSFDDKTPDLIVPAVMIAVVGFLETVAVGGKMANEKRYSYDANQELLALGAANVGGAFMGAFPITGGFSRTAVNAMFGASSPLAGALTSIIVVIAVYSLMPVVEMLPLAALAPLIIHGAIGVTDFKAFIPTFKGNKLDFLIMVFTFLVSLGLTVKEGLITGVSLSILKLTYEVAMPNLAVCVQVKDGTFRDVRYYPEGRMFPKCVVVRMDAGLSFANTRRLQEFCMRAMTAASKSDSSVSHLILDCKSVNGTDMTGCEAIESLAISLEKRKKSLVLANLKAPLTQAMFAAGVDQHIEAHGGHLCWNIAQAITLVNGGDPAAAKATLRNAIQ
eukprot:g13821.t2